MKIDDFHKMVGITNEEQRQTYYRIHKLGVYSCPVCDEIIYDILSGCPICKGEGKEKVKL